MLHNINLEWKEIQGAKGYEVEIARKDKTGKYILYGQLQKTTRNAFDAILPPGDYQLKLRSLDVREIPGKWSPPSTFQIKMPQLESVFPKDGAAVSAVNKTITLSWQKLVGASGYAIEITDIKSKRVITKETTTESLTVQLLANRSYLWSVRPMVAGISDLEKQKLGSFKVTRRDAKSLVESLKILVADDKMIKWNRPKGTIFYQMDIVQKQGGKWVKVMVDPKRKSDFLDKSRLPNMSRFVLLVRAVAEDGSRSNQLRYRFSTMAEANKTTELHSEIDTNFMADDEPFFFDARGNPLTQPKGLEETVTPRPLRRGVSLGYFTTFSTPSLYHRVAYSPHTNLDPQNKLWDDKGVRTTSSWCFLMKYTTESKNHSNYVLTGYFRFYDYLVDSQNYNPTNADSYVETTQMAYSAGVALDRFYSFTANSSLLLAVGSGLGLERSLVEYKATAFTPTIRQDFADFASELYLLNLRLLAGFIFDFKPIGFGITANVLAPVFKMPGNQLSKVEVPTDNEVTFSADVETDLAKIIHHKTRPIGVELIFDVTFSW